MKLIKNIVIILLLNSLFFHVNAQSRWIKGYYLNKDAVGKCFNKSIDNGYIIIGKHGSNYVHYLWMIKTDINGDHLWEKTIGEYNSYLNISDLATNEAGEIFLAGSTNYYEPIKDPLIIKLDSCAEKEWCRVFHTPDNFDYSNFVLATKDGGCVTILRYTGDDPTGQIDRICLAKLSRSGELLWKQCYNSPDSGIINAEARDLIITPDHGYLITGDCGYPDPIHPNMYWTKPYFIKTDSLGNFQWETVVHSNVGGEAGGVAWSTTLNPEDSYFYSSIRHHYPDYNAPALLKMDLDGNVIDIYDIVVGYNNGGLGYATFINDTVLAASIGWGNTEDDHKGYAVLLDTLGNIIDTTFLVQDIYTKYMDTAYDEKLVYMYNTYQNGQFDVYLRKLNQNLEDDTLYSFPFQYDTLCPYPIASDTIVQDNCGLIVGMPEPIKSVLEEPEQLLIYPNPASNRIRVQGTELKIQGSILILDILGRKIDEIKIPEGQKEVEINVSSYSQGIYIAVLWDAKRITGRKKFVVARP